MVVSVMPHPTKTNYSCISSMGGWMDCTERRLVGRFEGVVIDGRIDHSFCSQMINGRPHFGFTMLWKIGHAALDADTNIHGFSMFLNKLHDGITKTIPTALSPPLDHHGSFAATATATTKSHTTTAARNAHHG